MAVEREKYQKVANLIIDKLEGGYYHPDMLKDGRVRDSRYSSSGETMFGIDRKAGGTLNTTPAGIKFWSIVDKSGARKNWDWNYKGGNLEGTLKNAASDVMYSQYDKLADLYLSPASRKIVESDDRLLFNFIYSTWNGSGWFQRFARDFNEAVSKGITNRDELVKVALQSRIGSSNSLVRQGGNKILGFINDLRNTTEEKVEQTVGYAKRNWIPITLILVGITGVIYFSYFYKGKGLNSNFKLS